jgi:hypothetical protein
MQQCARFVVYEGCLTMVGIAISGLMMFLRCDLPLSFASFLPRRADTYRRVKALYHTHPPVYLSVFFIWATFVSVNSWLLTHAERASCVAPLPVAPC